MAADSRDAGVLFCPLLSLMERRTFLTQWQKSFVSDISYINLIFLQPDSETLLAQYFQYVD